MMLALRGGVVIVLAGFFVVVMLSALLMVLLGIGQTVYNVCINVGDWLDERRARERNAGGLQ